MSSLCYRHQKVYLMKGDFILKETLDCKKNQILHGSTAKMNPKFHKKGIVGILKYNFYMHSNLQKKLKYFEIALFKLKCYSTSQLFFYLNCFFNGILLMFWKMRSLR